MRRTDQRRAAVFALYQADVTGRAPADILERDAKDFTRELIEGVTEWREQLDELIGRHAEGWSLERIAPLERNILRVSLYELLHRDDVPAEVAIDEAVESAKEFASADAPGFVNGILGAVQREETAAR
jgi:transcription antitermination protein NusB